MTLAIQPKAVLFDLDGTLADTAPDFYKTVNQLRALHDLPDLNTQVIRAEVSNGAKALVKLALNLTEEHPEYEQKRRQLLELYSQNLGNETTIFPGIADLLEWLDTANIPWGIVTNKPVHYAKPLLESLTLTDRCSVLICPENTTHRKPHPEPLLLATKHLSIDAAKCLYIGDHARDIQAGKAANMRTIAALYGYISQYEDPTLWQADWYAQDCQQIFQLITTQ